MSKKIIIGLIVLMVFSLMLTACGPTFKLDETVWLEKSHRVNPRDYGGYMWMKDQWDNCTLDRGTAVITAIGDDRSYVVLKQDDCSGWINVAPLSKYP